MVSNEIKTLNLLNIVMSGIRIEPEKEKSLAVFEVVVNRKRCFNKIAIKCIIYIYIL